MLHVTGLWNSLELVCVCVCVCVCALTHSPLCRYERKRKAREPCVGEFGRTFFFVRMYNQAAPFRFHGEITIYLTFKLTLVHSLLGHIFP